MRTLKVRSRNTASGRRGTLLPAGRGAAGVASEAGEAAAFGSLFALLLHDLDDAAGARIDDDGLVVDHAILIGLVSGDAIQDDVVRQRRSYHDLAPDRHGRLLVLDDIAPHFRRRGHDRVD